MVGNFDEGQTDIFSGPSSLGECSGFLVRKDGERFSMGKSREKKNILKIREQSRILFNTVLSQYSIS